MRRQSMCNLSYVQTVGAQNGAFQVQEKNMVRELSHGWSVGAGNMTAGSSGVRFEVGRISW
jgi:hypothetical protein